MPMSLPTLPSNNGRKKIFGHDCDLVDGKIVSISKEHDQRLVITQGMTVCIADGTLKLSAVVDEIMYPGSRTDKVLRLRYGRLPVRAALHEIVQH